MDELTTTNEGDKEGDNESDNEDETGVDEVNVELLIGEKDDDDGMTVEVTTEEEDILDVVDESAPLLLE